MQGSARTWFVGEQLNTSSLCTVRVVRPPPQLQARALWAARCNANGLTTCVCDTSGVGIELSCSGGVCRLSEGTHQRCVDKCHVVRQAGGPYPLGKVAEHVPSQVKCREAWRRAREQGARACHWRRPETAPPADSAPETPRTRTCVSLMTTPPCAATRLAARRRLDTSRSHTRGLRTARSGPFQSAERRASTCAGRGTPQRLAPSSPDFTEAETQRRSVPAECSTTRSSGRRVFGLFVQRVCPAVCIRMQLPARDSLARGPRL